VRSASCAIEMIGKDIGSPFVLIRTHSRDDDGHTKRSGTFPSPATPSLELKD
jgi:hypothetical protein